MCYCGLDSSTSKSIEALTVTSHSKEDFANMIEQKALRVGGCRAILGLALYACVWGQKGKRRLGAARAETEAGRR